MKDVHLGEKIERIWNVESRVKLESKFEFNSVKKEFSKGQKCNLNLPYQNQW
jgi:hypothetical protein